MFILNQKARIKVTDKHNQTRLNLLHTLATPRNSAVVRGLHERDLGERITESKM